MLFSPSLTVPVLAQGAHEHSGHGSMAIGFHRNIYLNLPTMPLEHHLHSGFTRMLYYGISGYIKSKELLSQKKKYGHGVTSPINLK